MNTNWNDPNFQGFGGRQSPFGKRPPRPKKEHKAIGTPHCRCLDKVQSGRLAIMACKRARPQAG